MAAEERRCCRVALGKEKELVGNNGQPRVLALTVRRPFLLIIVRSQLAERNLSTSHDARTTCPQLDRLRRILVFPLSSDRLSSFSQRGISYERRTHASRWICYFYVIRNFRRIPGQLINVATNKECDTNYNTEMPFETRMCFNSEAL